MVTVEGAEDVLQYFEESMEDKTNLLLLAEVALEEAKREERENENRIQREATDRTVGCTQNLSSTQISTLSVEDASSSQCEQPPTRRSEILHRRCCFHSRHEVGQSSMGVAGPSRSQSSREERAPRQEGPENFDPRVLPEVLRHRIEHVLGGTNIVPVIQKMLTKSDVNKKQSRMFLPKSKIASLLSFLDEDEAAVAELPSTKNMKREVLVQVIGPTLRPHTLSFRKWDLKKARGRTPMYVLTTAAWGEFLEDNKLNAGDVIQLWSFRVQGSLNMAMVVVEKDSETGEREGEDGSA